MDEESATFVSLGLTDGQWSGILRADTQPQRILLLHLGQPVAQAQVSPAGPGEWRIAVDVPPAVLTDGCHNLLLIADAGAGAGDEPPQPGAARIAALPIAAGAPLDDDLRAEIELLRAEMEIIKAELRRMARG
ncbi:MAG: hypothetical protein Q4G22_10755 [Paracoccus sp. (in: a-proteobacteria)]|uniref:hypothetical protein n=1 Tax=Paracoccus sp. TaxID=267 RepID=UPI0026E092B3|nr:hypothetical protein [Paracoccus sp. (in: a-proteobacteria)]MDO5632305.1 hypothetical protein [Paracoccus sp. (in: a-proteobacteria)]